MCLLLYWSGGDQFRHAYLARILRAILGLCGHVLPFLISDLLVHRVEEFP